MPFLPPLRSPALLLLVATTILTACKGTAEDSPQRPPAPTIQGMLIRFADKSPQLDVIRIEAVKVSDRRDIDLPGRISWDEEHTSRVLAPLAGRITRLDVQPGQAVRAGQPLAHLNSPDLGQAEADVARARADAVQSAKALERVRELEAAGAMARRDLEAAQADQARTQAELRRAEARLQGLGHSETTVGMHDSAKGEAQSYALRSPISGWVVERNANIGQEFRPDQQGGPGSSALFTISDPRKLWVQFEVPEGLSTRMSLGMPIEVRIDALPDQAAVTTRVAQVADSLDAQTRTLRVRVDLPNPERRLKAEMFVHGLLRLPTAQPEVEIPASAAVLIQGKHQVFLRTAPGQFERRAVQAEESGIGRLRVRSGLKAGDELAVEGALMLQQLIATGGAH